ncbi:hypothetical protein PCYB_002950 [Plasmodium cynomolgi strain B]|uniref:CYIR protein n=1 Tax=Plasmodium cynomolgi (strain B) TaxID=1120755 RepID=K6UF62_PLACD|nr:hypothetical protein PCYB_002950 [Plasmodium cynomolgi strain B]GAB69546.1 hypothetical protein PCYB_002950 [Plasmodium cynomolgi strain B]
MKLLLKTSFRIKLKKNIKNFIYHCEKIHKYLEHFKTDDLCSNIKCCHYINYFLNNIISISNYKDKDNTFRLFKSYIENNKNINTNICVNVIQKIDDNVLKEIRELYKLYDDYEKIIEDDELIINKSLFCNTLKEFVTKFNNVVGKLDLSNSNYLFNKLKNLKCLIEKNDLFTSDKCDSNLLEFTAPKVNNNSIYIFYTLKCNFVIHLNKELF